MKKLIILTLNVMLCACAPHDSPTTNPEAAETSKPVPHEGPSNPLSDQLASFSEAKQQKVLEFLVKSSGQQCSDATLSFYQGIQTDGGAVWNVRCTLGGDYIVLILADDGGSTRILQCGVLNALAGGKSMCWTKL